MEDVEREISGRDVGREIQGVVSGSHPQALLKRSGSYRSDPP